MTSKIIHVALALATGITGLTLDENITQGLSLNKAEAVIGRPLTPMSYAGVARRTTRRAAYRGPAYAGAATAYAYSAPPVYAAPPVYSSGCVQTVDAYGQVYNRC